MNKLHIVLLLISVAMMLLIVAPDGRVILNLFVTTSSFDMEMVDPYPSPIETPWWSTVTPVPMATSVPTQIPTIAPVPTSTESPLYQCESYPDCVVPTQ